MSLGGGGGQLQQLAEEIQALEQEVETLESEIDGLQNEKREIDEAIEAINVLDTGETVQVPLGGDAYVRAEVQDIDEIIVSLGGGYAAEREQDNAIDTLENKQDTLDDRIEDLRAEISEIESESEQLEQQAQQMQQQQMQQQMAQMQQQQQGEDDDE
ncbi:MAG: prefoldin subunit alpha [Halorientalis sp.]